MPVPAPGFTPRTLAFLRALQRNNRREWFHERRPRYDADVHAPMVAVIERLAVDFETIAPDFVANPKVSMFRPFRDTRFSADKSPLKTHVAAVFPHRALGRLQGAALYFEVAPKHVWIGGGLYAPDGPTLHAVRTHIADRHRDLARILAAAPFERLLGTMQGDQAARVPRGFDPAHPAADVLRHKQFLAAREEPAEFAVRPDFYRELLASFAAMTPFVRFLNEPIIEARRHLDRDPLAAGRRRDRLERP